TLGSGSCSSSLVLLPEGPQPLATVVVALALLSSCLLSRACSRARVNTGAGVAHAAMRSKVFPSGSVRVIQRLPSWSKRGTCRAPGATVRSRWTRFLAVVGSGTLQKIMPGAVSPGSSEANSSEEPAPAGWLSTADQNWASLAALPQSKAIVNEEMVIGCSLPW